MTTSQAAKVIGCSTSQVGRLIRAGKLQARKLPGPFVVGTYYYDIAPSEARRYAKTKTGGWPRGQPRN